MDFDFSDEQAQLREAVSRWVAKAYTFERRRTIVADGGLDRSALTELAELGLTALTVPETHGGLGMGAVEVMVVLEQLGKGMVIEPLGQQLVSAGVLTHAGDALQSQWLPRMASGEALVTLAHQERGARYRLDRCATVATPAANGWRLSGAKHIVPGGDRADGWIVPANTADGLALFLVAADAPGVRASGYLSQDGSRAGDLLLDQAHAALITHQGQAALQGTPLVAVTQLLRNGFNAHPLRLIADQFDQHVQLLLWGDAWHGRGSVKARAELRQIKCRKAFYTTN